MSQVTVRAIRAALVCCGVCVCTIAAVRAAQENTRQPAAVQPLEPGRPVERSLSGGEAHTFVVRLGAGEHVALVVDQRGVDVQVDVLDTARKPVISCNTESRLTGAERVDLVSDTASDFFVRIGPRYAKLTDGTYRLREEERRVATADDRTAFEIQRLGTEAQSLETAGKAAEAVPLLTQAITLAERAPIRDERYLLELMTRRGEAERTRGNRAEAERLLERAVAQGDATLGRNDPQTAAARARIGTLYMYDDDFARAEPLLAEAVAVLERSLGPRHPRVAAGIIPQALLQTLRRDFDRAIPLLQKGLAIAEQTLDPTDFTYLALVNNLGDAYVQRNDVELAEPIVTRALRAIEDAFGADHIRVTNPLLNLGVIAREKQEYERALEFLWRAHGIRAKVLGQTNAQTASLLISIGNVQHAQGAYGEAIGTFTNALGILETAAGPYHSLTMMTLANLSRTSAAAGRVDEAIAYQARVEGIVEKNIAVNIRIGSERQKLAYFESTRNRTSRTLSFHNLLAPDDPSAAALAVQVILQRKGRVLDAMAGNLDTLRRRLDPESQGLLDKLRDTTTEFAALALNGPGRLSPAEHQKKLRALEDAQDSLEAVISRRSAAFRAATQPLTLQAIQEALPDSAVLVEFILYETFDPKHREDRLSYGDPRYAVYLIRANGSPASIDLGPAAAIDRAVASFRAALRNPRSTDVRQRARALDRLVFQPVRARIGAAEHVLISPDGALNLVPFEALVDARGRFVVQDHSISYLTSGRDLLRMQVPQDPQGPPLVIADPAFGQPPGTVTPDAKGAAPPRNLASTYFAPLTGTAREAQVIGSLFPDATVLTGGRATKTALASAEAPSILHIASHGFFLEDAPAAGSKAGTPSPSLQNPLLRAGVALAGANSAPGASQSGILTALEAANLNLWGTQLVTLSACDTGVGDVRPGEGVYGLRRAFVLAGAESLVMSLWPVSDYGTRQMMTAYYRGLKEGLGRAEALRQARLQMLARDTRRHPYHWASFIQSGAWGPLPGRQRP